jgi:Lanthionine-containing peptide SapB precursor RamS
MALLDIQSMNAVRDDKCGGGGHGGGGGGGGVASDLSVLLCDSFASILIC